MFDAGPFAGMEVRNGIKSKPNCAQNSITSRVKKLTAIKVGSWKVLPGQKLGTEDVSRNLREALIRTTKQLP